MMTSNTQEMTPKMVEILDTNCAKVSSALGKRSINAVAYYSVRITVLECTVIFNSPTWCGLTGAILQGIYTMEQCYPTRLLLVPHRILQRELGRPTMVGSHCRVRIWVTISTESKRDNRCLPTIKIKQLAKIRASMVQPLRSLPWAQAVLRIGAIWCILSFSSKSFMQTLSCFVGLSIQYVHSWEKKMGEIRSWCKQCTLKPTMAQGHVPFRKAKCRAVSVQIRRAGSQCNKRNPVSHATWVSAHE